MTSNSSINEIYLINRFIKKTLALSILSILTFGITNIHQVEAQSSCSSQDVNCNDQDGDGILDHQDHCPNEYDPTNVCPNSIPEITVTATPVTGGWYICVTTNGNTICDFVIDNIVEPNIIEDEPEEQNENDYIPTPEIPDSNANAHYSLKATNNYNCVKILPAFNKIRPDELILADLSVAGKMGEASSDREECYPIENKTSKCKFYTTIDIPEIVLQLEENETFESLLNWVITHEFLHHLFPENSEQTTSDITNSYVSSSCQQ